MKKLKNKKRFIAGQKIEGVSRYISEGNPNTDKMIEKEGEQPSIDAQLAQEVKEAINEETSLSEVSRNVQVTANDGVVTLIGHVVSEDERMIIDAKAMAIAGVGKVNNQVQVGD